MTSEQEGRLSEIAKQINRTPPSRVPFEDLVMSEVVDDRHRPFPDGQPEDWSLVTVLFKPDPPPYPATTSKEGPPNDPA